MPYLLSAHLNSPVDDPDAYPLNVPAVAALKDRLELHPKCTFLVGENGMGKSTLLEAIAVNAGFNAEGGSKNLHFSTQESHSDLYRAITLARAHFRPKNGYFLRAESFYNVASEIDWVNAIPAPGKELILSYGGKSLHEQSHGEAFFSLFMNRFGKQGIYILDEPEAALSPSRQLSFLVRLHDLIEMSCQFIIATHSPIILSYPDAWIYELAEDGLTRTNYQDTDLYNLTRRFLENPDRMLNQLLAE